MRNHKEQITKGRLIDSIHYSAVGKFQYRDAIIEYKSFAEWADDARNHHWNCDSHGHDHGD